MMDVPFLTLQNIQEKQSGVRVYEFQGSRELMSSKLLKAYTLYLMAAMLLYPKIPLASNKIVQRTLALEK